MTMENIVSEKVFSPSSPKKLRNS